MKRLIATAVAVMLTMGVFAQNGTNSPYSQYGLGILADQGNGPSKGMAGVGIATREHNQVNTLNPASLSALDSLSMIFDAGVCLQLSHYEENGVKKNANNAKFDYFIAGFRALRHLGVSFGFQPYSSIGYDFSNTANVNAFPSEESKHATYTNTYYGDGSLREAFVGVGWEPFKGLSVGFSASYLWGDYTRMVINSYSDSYVNTLQRMYNADVRSYKLKAGLQLTLPVSKNDDVTLGLTYDFGHKLGADPKCNIYSQNSQTGVSDSTTFTIDNGLKIPGTAGVGLLWRHKNQWQVGVDYTLQKWSKIDYPQYNTVNNQSSYTLASGLFKDRHKVALGVDYCHGEQDRHFLGRVHYRAGFGYTTPYLKINGEDGPKEMTATIGFGIPIINGYTNRSMLNISAQWVRRDAKQFIKEDVFRINVGFTFNERWFAKFKVE